MEFTIINKNIEMPCKVVDISELHEGREHGLVYINPDGSKGKTLVSNCPKTDAFRYGPSNIEMFMRGWHPFVYQDGPMAA